MSINIMEPWVRCLIWVWKGLFSSQSGLESWTGGRNQKKATCVRYDCIHQQIKKGYVYGGELVHNWWRSRCGEHFTSAAVASSPTTQSCLIYCSESYDAH